MHVRPQASSVIHVRTASPQSQTSETGQSPMQGPVRVVIKRRLSVASTSAQVVNVVTRKSSLPKSPPRVADCGDDELLTTSFISFCDAPPSQPTPTSGDAEIDSLIAKTLAALRVAESTTAQLVLDNRTLAEKVKDAIAHASRLSSVEAENNALQAQIMGLEQKISGLQTRLLTHQLKERQMVVRRETQQQIVVRASSVQTLANTILTSLGVKLDSLQHSVRTGLVGRLVLLMLLAVTRPWRKVIMAPH